MSYWPFNAKITRVVIPVLALIAIAIFSLPLSYLAFAQDADAMVDYAENGMGPVATFTASDPEGDLITWTLLDGPDASSLGIEGGVLTFNDPPDFEMQATYTVTVQASDGSALDPATKLVTVNVTDVDELGMVMLSTLQPKAGIVVTAELEDPDDSITGTEWEWSKSSSMTSGFAPIDDAEEETYTVKDADAGMYLRAMATYNDGEGIGKTAMAVPMHMTIAHRSANATPEFPDDEEVDANVKTAERNVKENTPSGQQVGDPVKATDGDSGDVLTYTLDAAAVTADVFTIDRATGQIMTKGALDYEDTGNRTYTVTVRATDPFGVPGGDATEAPASSYDEVEVTIMVDPVDEPPAISGVTEVVTYAEGQAITEIVAMGYSAPEPESQVVTWSVSGTDGSKFTIASAGGELTFRAMPDFEAPGDANRDNVYEIMVVATDSEANSDMEPVRVRVTNVEEAGMVTMSTVQPHVGVPVAAMVTDPDGGVSGVTWQWYRSVDNADLTAPSLDDTDEGEFNSSWTLIEDAESATYTPETSVEEAENDVGRFLLARATYTDGTGSETTNGVSGFPVREDTRNKAPYFPDTDMDTPGMQDEGRERKVAENTTDQTDTTDDGNVGASPVAASDPNTGDNLTYTLGGADGALFSIDSVTGQIKVKAGTELDYETKATYMVTVTATDSVGLSATTMVTITVTPVNEGPKVTGDAMVDYAENGMGPVATFTASDPEGDLITWTLLDGPDASSLGIEGGVLTFNDPPDFEMQATYTVTVQASDGSALDPATKLVTVNVTDVDELGMVMLSTLQPKAGIVVTAELEDPDDSITGTEWEWSKSSSMTSGFAPIDDAEEETYTVKDADAGMYLRAMATYNDGEGIGKTAMAVPMHMTIAHRSANATPEFPDDEEVDANVKTAERNVKENTPSGQQVGDPVKATDGDSGDVLTYTLDAAAVTADVFTIDRATGQIMTKGALDYEDTGNRTYTVTVRATDPFGVPGGDATEAPASSYDEVEVTIMVDPVDEPPAISGVTEVVTYAEGQAITEDVATGYMAPDPEGQTVTWSVSGTDGSKFTIPSAGEGLTFRAMPDFEAPGDANRDNVYEIMVVATDSEANSDMEPVRVRVTNVEEAGMVTMSTVQPHVGVPVAAMVTDPDGGVSGVTWQWYRSVDNADLTAPSLDDTDEGEFNSSWTLIEDAESATYTPETSVEEAENDVGRFLLARATYTDGTGSETTNGVSGNPVREDTRNKAPYFPDTDMDTPGMQDEGRERKVAENTTDQTDTTDDGNVGASPVAASDPNTGDNLTYTLGGADGALFSIDSATGQIKVKAGTELDYETKATYMVTVTATDSVGLSATTMVTITVTPVNEAPTILTGGLVITGSTSTSYYENASDPVGSYMASGPDAAMASWSLSGDDRGDFSISSDGVLTFSRMPDFEMPTDADENNVYMVTVGANDGTNDAMRMVTVTVINEDEPGRVTFWRDGADATAAAIMVGDELGGAVDDSDGNPGDTFPIAMYTRIAGVNVTSWQWAKSMTHGHDGQWDGHRDRRHVHRAGRRCRTLPAGDGDVHGRGRHWTR